MLPQERQGGVMGGFVAIDFETADHGRDSACAVALAVVRDGEVVDTVHRLIRPPRRTFRFTHIHGIAWEDVAGEEEFGAVWPGLAPLLDGAEFLVAHNAAFDRGVLQACCAAYDLPPPRQHFECTVQMARRAWGLYPTKLPDVCRHLGIPLRHHDAASDAAAAARIAVAALRAGVAVG